MALKLCSYVYVMQKITYVVWHQKL